MKSAKLRLLLKSSLYVVSAYEQLHDLYHVWVAPCSNKTFTVCHFSSEAAMCKLVCSLQSTSLTNSINSFSLNLVLTWSSKVSTHSMLLHAAQCKAVLPRQDFGVSYGTPLSNRSLTFWNYTKTFHKTIILSVKTYSQLYHKVITVTISDWSVSDQSKDTWDMCAKNRGLGTE